MAEKKGLKFVLSDESINSYGYRVLTSGIDLKMFRKNPIMFYNHDRYDRLPIGKWVNIEVSDGKLTAEPEFDENDEFAAQIKSKVEQDILNAASIGFRVLAISDDEKDMLKGQKRPTVTRSQLTEVSIVDIPGNRNAFKLQFDNGLSLSGDVPERMLNDVLPIVNKISDKNMKEIALMLGLAEDASPEAVNSAIKALQDKSTAADSLLMGIAKEKGFKEEHITNILKGSDFNAVLNLVQDVKSPQPPLKKGEENPSKSETDSEPPQPSSGKGGEKPDNTRLSDVVDAIATRLGEGGNNQKPAMTLKQMMKDAPEEAEKLLKENPKQYKAMFEKEYGFAPSDEDLKC